jgi:hypothetical protein
MRKLFIAMILATLAASSAQAQLATAPEGAIIPNGALHYVVPSGIPIVAWGGHAPWPSHFPTTPLYALSYPMVPVPMRPIRSTSDRIKPRIPLDPHHFPEAEADKLHENRKLRYTSFDRRTIPTQPESNFPMMHQN